MESAKWNSQRESKRYRRREPERSALYRIVYNYHERLERVWEERFQSSYGAYRDEVREAFEKYLDCGVLWHGCALATCENPECKHSEVIAFSCKRRGLCPSCAQKRGIVFAESLQERVLMDLPLRHVVFTIPKRLRAYFRYDREISKHLFHAAWRSVEDLYNSVLPQGKPGCVMALESAGELLNFHPHLHTLLTDGVLSGAGEFLSLGSLDTEKLCGLFEYRLFRALKDLSLVTDTTISQIQSWQASGFNVWAGPVIEPGDIEARLYVSQYLTKCPVRLDRIEILDTGQVRYHGKEQHKEFDPLEFLALVSSHIPGTFEQVFRYYGAYSARTRGKRNHESEVVPTIILGELPEKVTVSSTWARLIKKVYELNPLVCPKCGGAMKIKSFITDVHEIRRLLKSLGIPDYRAPLALPIQQQELTFEAA